MFFKTLFTVLNRLNTMVKQTYSERKKTRYRVRVAVGLLIAIWATVILGIGLYIKCCAHTEDSWVSNLQTPIWTGGILLTTGLLFLCSSARPRKSSGEMLDAIVVLVLILTVLSEAVFVYNFINIHITEQEVRKDQVQKQESSHGSNHDLMEMNYKDFLKKYKLDKVNLLKDPNLFKTWMYYRKMEYQRKNHTSVTKTQRVNQRKEHDNDDDDDYDGDDYDGDDDDLCSKVRLTKNLYLSLIVLASVEIILLSSIILKWGYKEKKAASSTKKPEDCKKLINEDRSKKDALSYQTFIQPRFQSQPYQSPVTGIQATSPPKYNDIFNRVTESSFV